MFTSLQELPTRSNSIVNIFFPDDITSMTSPLRLLIFFFFSRITLESSKFPQTLHSAVIVDHMMLVFGGNSYVPSDNNSKCHSTKLHVYDLGKLFLVIIVNKS